MDLYEGKQKDFSARGLGGFVMLKNMGLVDIPSNHSFYFDNFFTNFELLKILSEQNVCASRAVD